MQSLLFGQFILLIRLRFLTQVVRKYFKEISLSREIVMIYFEKKLAQILEATIAPEAPPAKAPPRPRTPEHKPWNPPKPKQIPQPKNQTTAPPKPHTIPAKPKETPKHKPWNPPRPKHQPQPKNYGGPQLLSQLMTEAYEDEVERGTQAFWRDLPKNREHTLGKHPIFAMSGDDLSRKSWAHTDQRAKASGGNMGAMMRVVQQIMRIEAEHVPELVELAKTITCKIWNIPRGMLEGDLTSDVEQNEADLDLDDIEGREVDDETRKQINKRLTLNAMTHGSAVHAMLSLHHAIDKEINAIDPRLLKLYDQLSSGSHSAYWLVDIPAMFAMLGAMAVGSTKIEYPETGEEEVGDGDEGKMPVIQARGIVFPVLAQEMNKGVAELLSHHGLSDLDEPTTKTVLQHADDIKHEPYLMQVGPEMWRRFLKVKPRDLPLSDLYMALSKQPPDDLHRIISTVVDDPENAVSLLSDLLAEPEEFEIDQWSPESEEGEEGQEDWR